METSHLVLRFAKRFFAGTMLSRLSGGVRDIAMAIYFGSAPEMAAFMVAYRLANLFRRLFGEGNLQSGFVPHFASLYREDPKKAVLFYRDSAFSLLTILGLGVACIETILWSLLSLLDPNWAEIVRLAMWMVPGLIFICLYGLNSAYLQYHKQYFVPGAAPVLFNAVWIIAAIMAARTPIEEGMRLLSLGVTIAFGFQWLFTASQVRKSIDLSWKEWFRPHIFSADWKKIVKPLTLGVVGIGATQINSALDAIFSRFSDMAGPAYLWYAIRIYQLPLALFGIALSGALFPSLSRALIEGDLDRYNQLLKGALRHSAALLIFCTFGIFALGGVGLNLLYGHGDFSPFDVQKTLYCLYGYGIGLVPSVFTLLLANGFYAQKSYYTPMLASLSSVVFHIILNAFFVFGLELGAFSIAISTSLSGLLNFLLLLFALRRYGICAIQGLGNYFLRLCLSGIAASTITLYFGYALFGKEVVDAQFLPRSMHLQFAEFIPMVIVFSFSFLAIAYVLRIKEIFEVLRIK